MGNLFCEVWAMIVWALLFSFVITGVSEVCICSTSIARVFWLGLFVSLLWCFSMIERNRRLQWLLADWSGGQKAWEAYQSPAESGPANPCGHRVFTGLFWKDSAKMVRTSYSFPAPSHTARSYHVCLLIGTFKFKLSSNHVSSISLYLKE